MIPLDGRPHDPQRALQYTFMGYSVGKWDGDVFVVESSGAAGLPGTAGVAGVVAPGTAGMAGLAGLTAVGAANAAAARQDSRTAVIGNFMRYVGGVVVLLPPA